LTSPYDLSVAAADALRPLGADRPDFVVVLGSGLTRALDALDVENEVSFRNLPGFGEPGVVGHDGRALVGRLSGTRLLVFAGRLHAYEGHDLATVVHPVRTAARLGAGALILTCAVGGIREDLEAGALALVKDHVNPSGEDPLRGPHDPRLGEMFPSLVDAYDPDLRRRIAAVADGLGTPLTEVVYARVPGPSYETPADIRALRTLGADVVGMSVVPEVIAARQAGLPVAALAVVTNRAAGLGGSPPDHEEVVTAGRTEAGRLGAIIDGVAAERSRE
jgi:inosine/guanosine/xanthosine phosphorylase family protein